MTPDEIVFATLRASGLKGTKVGWPVGGAPPLPWFTYKHVKGGEFFADNSDYAFMRRYDIDLYQREPNDEEVERFEEAISHIGPYKCIETWEPGESCWITSYTVTYHPDN